MCTRELQSWRDSAAVDWMPSKPKPHRHIEWHVFMAHGVVGAIIPVEYRK